MNLAWKIVTGVFSGAILVVLIWGLLYLCIPNVKTWTDEKVFGTGVVEEEKDTTTEKEEVEVPETTAVIDFAQLKILIGG